MATQNRRAQSAVKLANHNARYNFIVRPISFLELGHILTVYYIYIYIYIYIGENLKKIGINMTDCIRSLFINWVISKFRSANT